MVEPACRLIGHVAWDGSTATSERVLLRAVNRQLAERNQYVRIQDPEGIGTRHPLHAGAAA
jgi:hypothetical protein